MQIKLSLIRLIVAIEENSQKNKQLHRYDYLTASVRTNFVQF
jgi:hypothetical protein